jgi:hypothetical protein
MNSYHPKLTRDKNFEELFKNFFETDCYDVFKREIARLELATFFADKKYQEIQSYVKTYWPIYIYSIWFNPLSIDPQFLIENLPKHLREMTRLGFNIMDKLLEYASVRLTLEPEVKSFFAKIQEELKKSNWPIGKLPNNTEYTIADCINELKLLESMADNSMKYAEFYEKLSRMIFPHGLEEEVYKRGYVDVSIHTALEGLTYSLLSLTQASPDDFYEFVDEYAHPEIYDPDYGKNIVNTTSVDAKIKAEKTVNLIEKEKEMPVVSATSSVSAPAKPSYAEISQKIDAVFEKDADGNYEDLDSVMMALEKAAKKYNDPKIAELYYFDEQAGKFKWGV